MLAKFHRKMGATFVALLAMGQIAAAQACNPDVQQVLDKQRESYIAAQSSLADQNFSRRPGSFAATTCLDDLMKGGGLDIFFKPPSLDSIIGMVKNLACEQASQIFDQIVGGSGINGGGALNPGELISGVNLGGSSIQIKLPSSYQGMAADRGNVLELFR